MNRMHRVGLAFAFALFGSSWLLEAAAAEPKPLPRPEPLLLPEPLPLSEPLVLERAYDKAVAALLVQGTRVWLRTKRPGIEGGGSAMGGVVESLGNGWGGTRFYESAPATTANAEFVAGVGGGVVLAGIAFTCCGSGSTAVFEQRGANWAKSSRVFPSGGEFPSETLSVAGGIAPMVCASGSQTECMRWVRGRPVRIEPPPGETLPLLDEQSGKVVAFAERQLYAWHGRWVEIGDPLPEAVEQRVRAVRIGTSHTVWLVGDSGLIRWDGKAWTEMPVPVGTPSNVLAEAPDRVWVSGSTGLGYLDGARWVRVSGIYGSLSRIARGTGEVLWIGGDTGLWRGTPRQGEPVSSRSEIQRGAEAQLPLATPLPVGTATLQCTPVEELRAQHVVRAARSLAVLDRERVLYDGRRIYSIDARTASNTRGLDSRWGRFAGGLAAWEAEPIPASPSCLGCMAVNASGIADITQGLVRWREPGRRENWGSPVGDPISVSLSPGGAAWVVGSGADPGLPLIARRRGDHWDVVDRWPLLAPAGLAVPGEDEAWVAGAASYEDLSVAMQRRQPPGFDPVALGKGVLDHLVGTELIRYIAEAPLLAVTTSPSEALVVAAGADGLLVELAHGVARTYRVSGSPWLYAAVFDGESVWVLGERGTILRRRAGTWTSLSFSGFVKPSFTALARDGARWLVGGPEALCEIRGDSIANAG